MVSVITRLRTDETPIFVIIFNCVIPKTNTSRILEGGGLPKKHLRGPYARYVSKQKVTSIFGLSRLVGPVGAEVTDQSKLDMQLSSTFGICELG